MCEYAFPMLTIVCHALKPGAAGIITGITIRPCGIVYLVTWSDGLKEVGHYEQELKLYEKKEIGGLKR